MQTPFVTDIVATAAPVASGDALAAVVGLKFIGQDGAQLGTAIADAATLAQAGRDLLALAQAAILAAAAPAHHAKPPRTRIMLMRDVRVAETA